MTDPQKSPANQRQPSASASLTWKSGLLAVSLAVVMAGSALVARFDQSAQTAQTARTVEATSTPAPTQTEVQTQGQQPARLAPLPARPLFQQPVTRTRRS
ncbi:MAG: hypothetical protein WAV74_08400 [Anaerolineae bacterium]|uniref:hypothetical protein n=1 Tax=Candidatus Amarolinea dominans TaxID=3140696 RepID=UPI003134EBB6|nr:hypothetical protein [Anaerolineae bacterium]